MTTMQPPALPSRRGLRRLVLGLVLAVLLPLALPLSAAQAFCGSICAPGAAPILAESAGISGGLISGATTTATTAAGVSTTAGAGAATLSTAAGANTGINVVGTLGATTVGSVIASVGGFFGVKALFGGDDPDAPVSSTGGSSGSGWVGSTTPHTWGKPSVPQFYPETNGTVQASGSADGVTVSATFPANPAGRENDRPQDVTVTVVALLEYTSGATETATVASLNMSFGATATAVVTAGQKYGAATIREVVAVVVSSALSRDGEVVETGRWTPASATATATVTVLVQCSNGSNPTASTPAVDWPATGGLDLPTVVCAAGSVMTHSTGIAAIRYADGSTTSDVLWDVDAPAWVGKIPQENPDCLTAGAACTLTLVQVQPDGSVKDCFANVGLCTGWIPKSKAGDTSFRCMFGPYVVEVTKCYAYPDPGVSEVPTATVDGTPVTPTPTTPTDPETPTTPAPGGAGSPNPSDVEGNRCFPSGWGMLNPVQWVYMPVKCALSWAFVPSASTTAALDGLGSDLSGKSPAPELGSVFLWLDPPTIASQCFTVQLELPALFGGSTTAVNSCGHDLFIGWLRDHRSLMTVVIWAACLGPFAAWAWREYAPGSKGVA